MWVEQSTMEKQPFPTEQTGVCCVGATTTHAARIGYIGNMSPHCAGWSANY